MLPDVMSILVFSGLLTYFVWRQLKNAGLPTWVRQNMKRTLCLAVGLSLGGMTYLRNCVNGGGVWAWLNVLGGLIAGMAAPPGALGAFVLLVLGVAVFGLAAWSWLFVQLDVTRHDVGLQKVLDYFAGHGLDYIAVLSAPARTPLVEPAWSRIGESCNKPNTNATLARRVRQNRTLSEEIDEWRRAAEREVQRLPAEDKERVTHEKSLKHSNGSHFLAELRGLDHIHGPLYVFAAILSRDESDRIKAQELFSRLVKSLK